MTAPLSTPATAEVTEDLPVIEMVRPLAGFPGLQRFALARLVDDGTICDLRSLDDPDVSFVVVPPTEFFGDYAPEVDEETVAPLDIAGVEDLLLLSVVTLGAEAGNATVNLRAPLLVNHRNRRALQAILDDPDLPMQAPLGARRDAVPSGTSD